MKNKENIHRILFLIVPILVLIGYNDLSYWQFINPVLRSFLVGGIVGIVGAALHWQVRKKKDIIVYGLLLLYIVALWALMAFLKKEYPPLVKIGSEAERAAVLNMQIQDFFKKIPTPESRNISHIDSLTVEQRKHLKTCEVCGYEAFPSEDRYPACYICWNSLYDPKTDWEKTKAEWLRNNQLFYFMPEDSFENVDFYSPSQMNGFVKNKSWKPTVTKTEVLVYANEE